MMVVIREPFVATVFGSSEQLSKSRTMLFL